MHWLGEAKRIPLESLFESENPKDAIVAQEVFNVAESESPPAVDDSLDSTSLFKSCLF